MKMTYTPNMDVFIYHVETGMVLPVKIVSGPHMVYFVRCEDDDEEESFVVDDTHMSFGEIGALKIAVAIQTKNAEEIQTDINTDIEAYKKRIAKLEAEVTKN